MEHCAGEELENRKRKLIVKRYIRSRFFIATTFYKITAKKNTLLRVFELKKLYYIFIS
jgi:hypothetical protein